MSKFYTSVESNRDKILLRGYEDGKHFQRSVSYKPYLFIESKEESKYKSHDDKFVKKITFDSLSEGRDFVKKYKDVKNFVIYGMDRFVYPYIYDAYPGEIKFDSSLIRSVFLDIETDSSGSAITMQQMMETAEREVTAITLRVKHERTVLGLVDFDVNKMVKIKDKQNIKYYKFKDEKALLRGFLEIWKNLNPDVVTGWYIEFFDIPYLVRRIKKVLGDDAAKMISPWRSLQEKTVEIQGKFQHVSYPKGVALLDYMALYKKFTQNQQESYSLNYIASVHLKGEKKLDYSNFKNLADLYEKDPQLFIEYNIYDVDLVYKLDEELKLLELVYAMSYDAKVNYEDTLGSVLLWDVIIHNYLMDLKRVVPPNNRKPFVKIEGGFVKEPILGIHKWIVSFDLTSLYPHLIMQYNISPEMFEGKLDDFPSIDEIIGGKNVTPLGDTAVAGNGCCYRKTKKGFLAALMERQFSLRNVFKSKMIEAEKDYQKTKNPASNSLAVSLYNAQWAKKIQMNSAYGALANEWFRWYDSDNAEAVTKSGQMVIQWVARDVNQYFRKIFKTDKDFVIAADTDSIYLRLDDLVESVGLGNADKKEVVEFLDKVSKEKIQPVLNKSFQKLAEHTNAYENKMVMKREAIADKGIWRAKKNYIMRVWNSEGVWYKEPKLKMTGIEAVKSSTPSVCREKIKETLLMMLDHTEDEVRDFTKEFGEEFKKLPFDEIAFPRSVKEINKWVDPSRGYKLGTPIHVKASLSYNNMLKKAKLTKKYPLIHEADKIKFAYLKTPNPTKGEVFAVPSFLPEELDLETFIDYDTQFDKSFVEPVKTFFNAAGWQYEKISTLESFFDQTDC